MAKNYYLAIKHLATEELMGVIKIPKGASDKDLIEKLKIVCNSHFDFEMGLVMLPPSFLLDECICGNKCEVKVNVEYGSGTEEETIEISQTFLY